MSNVIKPLIITKWETGIEESSLIIRKFTAKKKQDIIWYMAGKVFGKAASNLATEWYTNCKNGYKISITYVK